MAREMNDTEVAHDDSGIPLTRMNDPLQPPAWWADGLITDCSDRNLD